MTTQILDQPRQSEWMRLTSVLLDPQRAFSEMGSKPRWLLPVVLLTLFGLVYLATFTEVVGWESFVAEQVKDLPYFDGMNAAQKQEAIALQAKTIEKLGYLSGLVGNALMIGAVAVLVFAVFRMIGVPLRFRQSLSVTAYGSAPLILSTVLATLVVALKDPRDFDFTNPLGLNVAVLLDKHSVSSWLYEAALSLDLFAAWWVALIAVGVSAASGKISVGRAGIVLALMWACWIGLRVAGSVLFG